MEAKIADRIIVWRNGLRIRRVRKSDTNSRANRNGRISLSELGGLFDI